jgi:uncharacterized caspase-like protein
MERVGDESVGDRADILLAAVPSHSIQAFKTARVLREVGFRVIQETLTGSGKGAIRSAVNDARSLAIPNVVLLRQTGRSLDEALLFTKSSESFHDESFGFIRKRIKIQDLPQLIPSPCQR